jgi:hypothetical protein
MLTAWSGAKPDTKSEVKIAIRVPRDGSHLVGSTDKAIVRLWAEALEAEQIFIYITY